MIRFHKKTKKRIINIRNINDTVSIMECCQLYFSSEKKNNVSLIYETLMIRFQL